MIANGCVNTEVYVFLVELVVTVLHQLAIETAPLGIEGMDAIRLSEYQALSAGLRVGLLASFLLLVVHDRLIAKAVDGVAKALVQDVERDVADVITMMRDDAVGNPHVIPLGFFLKPHFCIEVTLVPNAELHVVAGLQGSLAVVDDGSLAQLTQETVETLRAVPAGKAVQAEGNIEDGKPFAVGTLRQVGLQFVGPDVSSFAADGCCGKQVTVLGNESRGAAAAQKKEGAQQEEWFYGPIYGFHTAKIQKK